MCTCECISLRACECACACVCPCALVNVRARVRARNRNKDTSFDCTHLVIQFVVQTSLHLLHRKYSHSVQVLSPCPQGIAIRVAGGHPIRLSMVLCHKYQVLDRLALHDLQFANFVSSNTESPRLSTMLSFGRPLPLSYSWSNILYIYALYQLGGSRSHLMSIAVHPKSSA